MPNKTIAALIAIMFGITGAHYAYLKQWNKFVVWLIAFFIFSWSITVLFMLFVFGIAIGISYLLTGQKKWDELYA